MSRACSNCGGTGHNARTCVRAAVARPPKPAKSPKQNKPAPPTEMTEYTSVQESLKARRDRLAHELETIDRILGDLSKLDPNL